MELLNLMGLSGWWLGKRFFIIANCILIDLTRSPFCRWQLTRQAAFTTTFCGDDSCMLTVKHRL
jgi:hypothetical protein